MIMTSEILERNAENSFFQRGKQNFGDKKHVYMLCGTVVYVCNFSSKFKKTIVPPFDFLLKVVLSITNFDKVIHF